MPLDGPPREAWRRCAGAAVGLATLAGALAVAGCSTTPRQASADATLRVVAAENVWGSLAAQLGGSHVRVRSIIDKPDADPHDYEATAADGRDIAGAKYVIVNGAGYDPWASKLISANPASGRGVLNVATLTGTKDGGNPHRWYSPTNVRQVIDQITADYARLDPSNAAFYQSQHDTVISTNLKDYFGLIDQIKATFSGTPVGASESIFTPLAEATGLKLLTPGSFLDAVSEGGDPTAADKATIDKQIKEKQIKVYVYNSQNATPDVQAQVDAAAAAGIAVTTMTETLTPAGATFQDWQVSQLKALQYALAQATGK